jgi:Utp14 protein
MAYHESVSLGQEITQRIHGDGATSDEDHEAIDSDNDVDRGAVSSTMAEQIGTILASESTVASDSAASRYHRLLDMDFMKRAAEKQREQAKEDAKCILKEIQDLEREVDSENENEADGNGGAGKDGKWSQRDSAGNRDMIARKLSPASMADAMGAGMGLSMSGKSRSLAVVGNITIPIQSSTETGWERQLGEHLEATGEASASASVVANPWISSGTHSSASVRAGGRVHAVVDLHDPSENTTSLLLDKVSQSPLWSYSRHEKQNSCKNSHTSKIERQNNKFMHIQQHTLLSKMKL